MEAEAFGRLHVLSVDDEPFSQQVLCRMLEHIGIGTISTAGDGQAALEVLSTADPPVDIVITDIEMPAMDGFEMARRIRWDQVPGYKDVPIVMLTAQENEEEYARKGQIHKIQAFVLKPPGVDMLRETLGGVA